jgi:hypothetical protein
LPRPGASGVAAKEGGRFFKAKGRAHLQARNGPNIGRAGAASGASPPTTGWEVAERRLGLYPASQLPHPLCSVAAIASSRRQGEAARPVMTSERILTRRGWLPVSTLDTPR